MDEQLRQLLNYEGILSVVASSDDGLVVGTGGLNSDDAEVMAAGGTVLLSALRERGEPNGSLQVAGGRLHVVRGDEISLLLLSEESVPHEAIVELMNETLAEVTGVLS